MSTLDTSDTLIVTPKPSGLVTRIVQAVQAYRARRAHRRALVRLSQYDAHMLRDMGLDPQDIEDALNQRSLSILFNPIRQSDTR